MFEKRRCHFTHIFELFVRYIYAIIVITFSIAFSIAGNITSDKELVNDVKEASGIVMSADSLAVLAVVGVLLLLSLIMLLYCAFKWRYTFVSAEENTLIYESGKFIKKRVAIPFEKINTIDMGRNIFERLVGTCRLKIDTGAYSQRQEKNNAEMNLVFSLKEAEEIRSFILSRAELDSRAEDIEIGKTTVAAREPEWVIKAGIGDFVLYGLTSSSVWKLFWIIIAGIFFVAEIAQGFLDEALNLVMPYVEWATDMISRTSIILTLLGMLIFFLITALISDVWTVIWAAIRFYEFRVAREGRNVIVRYGLITVKNYTLQVRNIHALIIKTSDLNKLLAVILPEYVTEMNAHPKNKVGIYFHVVKPIIIWGVILAGCCVACSYISGVSTLVNALALVLFATVIVSGVLSYKNTMLDWNDNVVSVQNGGFKKVAYRIRSDAVQEVQIKTNVIKKQFGIGSYYVHFHGPRMNNTSISKNISNQFFTELARSVED